MRAFYFLMAILAAALMALPDESFIFATSSHVGPELRVEEEGHDNIGRVVNVYVYDHPVFEEADVIQCYRDYLSEGVSPWQDEQGDRAQDTGEIWLHQSLLSHPWRVLDPEDADLFFIPMYPVLNGKLRNKLHSSRCGGGSKSERATRSIMHLVKNSPYFNRFGGADHIVVCSWWNCGGAALDRGHRMLLRRAVVGINEKLDDRTQWVCGERMVSVPYTPSSAVTTTSVVGGLSAEERNIPFFFVGTSRSRPERENLQVVQQLSPDSVIVLGTDGHSWSESSTSYAEQITRSRFCFCPRGDTVASRRLFDAVAAGCIPVITTEEFQALPFQRTGLNYTEFVVVAGHGSFSTTEGVEAIVKDLSSRSDQQLIPLREGLVRGRASIVYGVTDGPTIADMHPYHGTASRFLQQVQTVLDDGGLWKCAPSSEGRPSPRTRAVFPPRPDTRDQWLRESETIVNVEHSLLFCAPPNAGSLQFRMLAKRMEGVDHWLVSDGQSLLFDPSASKLPLLDLTDRRLMENIYKDNNSGWIKIGVVRDPVTRLLSAYLDLVRKWPSRSKRASPSSYNDVDPNQPPRGLRAVDDDDWEWFEGIARHRELTREEAKHQQPDVVGEHRPLRTEWAGDTEGERAKNKSDDGSRLLRDVAAEPSAAAAAPIPTFEELLGMLKHRPRTAPTAFRPASSLCGMALSPFDTIIPFETLQKTSTKVFKSLPGDIWRDFGESGWGPHGEHAFMEFDYGTVTRHYRDPDQDTAGFVSTEAAQREQNDQEEEQKSSTVLPQTASPRARDLFSDGSCAWTEYYTDKLVLDKVGDLYSQDFELFGWYDLHQWRERLKACLN